MSRSQYVWVVTGPHRGIPVAAFTVKHELRRWLSENMQFVLNVVRFKDGEQIGVWLDSHTLDPLKEGE